MNESNPILYRSPTAQGEIRFLASPVYSSSRRSDHPWHVYDDLLKAMGVAEGQRVEFYRRLAADWSDETKVVATADGIVRIAPHFVAQGLIASFEEDAALTESLRLRDARRAYFSGVRHATAKMLGTSDRLRLLTFTLDALGESGTG